jgi:twitching motility protein PilT
MANENLTLTDLLKRMTEMRGSDLHITLNAPPQIRVDGHMHPLSEFENMTAADTKALAYSVLTDAQKHRFEEDLELDFSFGVKGLSRFRANLFNQKGAVAAVFRAIPYEIKSFEQLNLPHVVSQLCEKPRGLILVTGPTGSGKSTTLAAMLDKINRERHDHILTIEDPIEFLHPHRNCLVNQREVKADTHGFSNALRSALRQDPDVVLIGEMRDLETIEAALRIAETGHMTFGTLHTNSAASTINRVIDVFPAYQQSQIRAQLSLVLEGVLCQTLLPKANGSGRAMAMEILVPNAAIRNLIREDKIHQIYSMMQTGQEKYGMQTLNQSLATLYLQKQITLEMALQRSAHQDELQDLINRGAGLIDRSGTTPKPAMPNRMPASPGVSAQPGNVATPAPPTPGTSPFAPSVPGASPFAPQSPGGNTNPFAPPGRR